MNTEENEKQKKPKLVARIIVDIYNDGTLDREHIAIITNEETGRKKKVNGLSENEFVKHLENIVGEEYAEKGIYEKIREIFEKGKTNVIP